MSLLAGMPLGLALLDLWASPDLSAVLAAGWLGILTLIWTGLLLGLDGWGSAWRLERPLEAPSESPLVSICVPARDELAVIGACVRAALDAHWPRLELIVMDEGSTDGTADAAAAAGSGDPRLRVLAAGPPPTGWSGKAWACARAAGEAKGALLLFLDADTRIDPDAVAALVGESRRRNLALLSAFGGWELRTPWSRLLVPVLGWLVRGSISLNRVNAPGSPDAFAVGALFMVDAEVYEAVGGHGAVRDQLLAEVHLAHAVKRLGRSIGLFSAPWSHLVGQPEDLRSLLSTWRRSLHELLGRRTFLCLGGILFLAVAGLLPFLLLPILVAARVVLGWGAPAWPWILWMTLVVGLQLLFRWMVDRRAGGATWSTPLHPLSLMLAIGVLGSSTLNSRAGWKGRPFRDGKASTPDAPEAKDAGPFGPAS